MLFFIIIGAFLATFAGGLFAIKYSDKLHLVLGFSAGAVVAVAFFDLLPEAIELAGKTHEISFITSIVALGFVLFLIVDRFFSLHHEHRGRLGASSLSLHSFLDGLAIGFTFQVSTTVGMVVALAVLAHDFSDGINTVSMILKNGGSKKEATKWLFVDAITPIFGIIVGTVLTVSESTLGLLLALFCGFFFYIGASDLIPESHHAHPTYFTTLMTILGVAVLYGAISLAGI
jgi:ZIP family zinc transporter